MDNADVVQADFACFSEAQPFQALPKATPREDLRLLPAPLRLAILSWELESHPHDLSQLPELHFSRRDQPVGGAEKGLRTSLSGLWCLVHGMYKWQAVESGWFWRAPRTVVNDMPWAQN